MIVLKGRPVSVNSMYWQRGKCRYLTAEGKAWKALVQYEAIRQWKKPILEGRVGMEYRMYFADRIRRDLANYEKLIGDSLTGIVYKDDSQIDHLTFIRFIDKDNPRIELRVWEIL